MKNARAIVVLGGTLLVFAVLTFRAFPRYDWRQSEQYKDVLIRVDRWTGKAQLGVVDARWGRWVSLREARADARAKAEATRAQTNRDLDDLIAEIDATLADSAPTEATTLRRAAWLLLAWAIGICCGWVLIRHPTRRHRARTATPEEPV